MGLSISRTVIAVASLMWLAGCVTASSPDGTVPDNPLANLKNPFAALASADKDVTGTVDAPNGPVLQQPLSDSPPVSTDLLGDDPNDDLNIGKKYFRQGSYGLAERHFRKAVELHPRDAESWVGLAAAYDRLRRFDLADRAYRQAAKLIGETPELMNNQGFSYMLRGDYRRARGILLAAQAKDPNSPYIANNLKLLAVSERKAKQVN
jgi:Flp pilus assembly protein TadD